MCGENRLGRVLVVVLMIVMGRLGNMSAAVAVVATAAAGDGIGHEEAAVVDKVVEIGVVEPAEVAEAAQYRISRAGWSEG